jgi:hypothetical protein
MSMPKTSIANMHHRFAERRDRIHAERHEARRQFWLRRGRLYVTTLHGGIELFANPDDTTLSQPERRELEIRYLRWMTAGSVAEDPFKPTEI